MFKRRSFWRRNPETIPSPVSISIINATKDSVSPPAHHLPTSLVYFKTYFNITYYLCLSPFNISYNHLAKSYVIHKSKYQNFACCLIQLSILFQFLSHYRGLDIHLLRLDPSNYFEIANALGNLVYYLILFPTLWARQPEILTIFNIVSNQFLNFSPNNNEESNRNGNCHESRRGSLQTLRVYMRPLILCSVFLGWTVYSVVTGLVAVNRYFILSIPRAYSSRAEFVYLFQSHECTLPNSTHLPGIFELNPHGDPLIAALTVWYIFIEFYVWFGTFYSDLLVLLSGMFVQRIVRDFVQSLHRVGTTAQIALQQYLWLKKIVQQLNLAVGPLVLCVVVSALPYYASNIETVFTTDDAIRRLRISFYCLVFFSSLVIAADGNTRIGEFKDWLLDEGRSSDIPQSSLYLVTHELGTFGLKGYGFFTITFGFFGTILSVLLTYSFIIVQFHSTPFNLNSTHAHYKHSG